MGSSGFAGGELAGSTSLHTTRSSIAYNYAGPSNIVVSITRASYIVVLITRASYCVGTGHLHGS